jgi:hypothetical protein
MALLSLLIIGELASIGTAHGVRSLGSHHHELRTEEAEALAGSSSGEGAANDSAHSSVTAHSNGQIPRGPHPVPHAHEGHHHDHVHDNRWLSKDSGFFKEDGALAPLPCGFPEPTLKDMQQAKEAEQSFQAKQEQEQEQEQPGLLQTLWKFLLSVFSFFGSVTDAASKTSIPTYYHVIVSSNSPSDNDVRQQINALNAAFGANTEFRFDLKAITRTRNNDWYDYRGYNTDAEKDMKTTLRKGGPESLNIYSTSVVAVHLCVSKPNSLSLTLTLFSMLLTSLRRQQFSVIVWLCLSASVLYWLCLQRRSCCQRQLFRKNTG